MLSCSFPHYPLLHCLYVRVWCDWCDCSWPGQCWPPALSICSIKKRRRTCDLAPGQLCALINRRDKVCRHSGNLTPVCMSVPVWLPALCYMWNGLVTQWTYLHSNTARRRVMHAAAWLVYRSLLLCMLLCMLLLWDVEDVIKVQRITRMAPLIQPSFCTLILFARVMFCICVQ